MAQWTSGSVKRRSYGWRNGHQHRRRGDIVDAKDIAIGLAHREDFLDGAKDITIGLAEGLETPTFGYHLLRPLPMHRTQQSTSTFKLARQEDRTASSEQFWGAGA
ncbi:hypothetical protein CF326_g9852 [Tilletia indica]|nr:hypothetical protein CF326_g9852 [Tilletia indica]